MEEINQNFMLLGHYIVDNYYQQILRQVNAHLPPSKQYPNNYKNFNDNELSMVQTLSVSLGLKQSNLDFLKSHKNLERLFLVYQNLLLDLNNKKDTTNKISNAMDNGLDASAIKDLPDLKILELFNIFNLKELDVSQNPNLEMILVRNASMLKNIKGLDTLHNLKALDISDAQFFKPDFDIFTLIDNNPNLEFLCLDYSTIPECVEKHPDFFERLEVIQNNRSIIFAWFDGDGSIFQNNLDFKVYLNEAKYDYENAQLILSRLIKPDMSYDMKWYAIHQYITQKIKYDFDSLNLEKSRSVEDHYKGRESVDMRLTHTALIKKEVVCSGYAKLTNYLCRLAGLDTRTVLLDDRHHDTANTDEDYIYNCNHIAVYDNRLKKYCDTTYEAENYRKNKNASKIRNFMLNFDEITINHRLNILEKYNDDKHAYPVVKRLLLDKQIEKYRNKLDLETLIKNTPKLSDYLNTKGLKLGRLGEKYFKPFTKVVGNVDNYISHKLSNYRLLNEIYTQTKKLPVIKNVSQINYKKANIAGNINENENYISSSIDKELSASIIPEIIKH